MKTDCHFICTYILCSVLQESRQDGWRSLSWGIWRSWLPTSGIRKDWMTPSILPLFHSSHPGGQTAVQSAVPADFGADSKVKGRQTTMAVNVFVFYCPPSRLPLTRPPTPPPFSQVYFPGHSSLAAKAFAYVDLESERTAQSGTGAIVREIPNVSKFAGDVAKPPSLFPCL